MSKFSKAPFYPSFDAHYCAYRPITSLGHQQRRSQGLMKGLKRPLAIRILIFILLVFHQRFKRSGALQNILRHNAFQRICYQTRQL